METNIFTGFNKLDDAIQGINKANLIVIASRPSMGKTAFALNIATNVAIRQKLSVAIFSLEMSKKHLIKRILCSKNDVDIDKVITETIEDEDFSEKGIYIDDTPAISINKIREECINLKKEKNIKLILIDSLELIRSDNNYDIQELKIIEITKKLKTLSKEIEIPIIVTSQLSNKPDVRFYLKEEARPKLTDLYSVVVEEADIIMLLYRDDYYNTESYKKDIAEVIVAKSMQENQNIVELLFIKKYLKFVSLKKCDEEDEYLEIEEISLKQKLRCLKDYTNVLDGINIKDVKQLEKSCWNDEIYVVLNNGDMYSNGILRDTKIDRLFGLCEIENMYKIKLDNTIVPMKNIEEWNNFDFYLHNENEPYKKIINNEFSITALTQENKVIAISFWETFGIVPENFLDVDDIVLEKDERGYTEPYVIKKGQKIQLYVRDKY